MAASTKPADITVCSTCHAHSNHQRLRLRLRLLARDSPGQSQSYCCSQSRPPSSRRAESCYSSSPPRSLYSTGTDESSCEQSEDGSVPDFGDHIDSTTFEQILEMDDDEEEREFSKSIVYDFFTQADGTFEKMHSNLDKKDLGQLSALGHFLKGSSATLGLTKVKDSCEKIQHFGAMKDETGTKDEPDVEKCLSNCKTTIEQAQKEFKEVESLLRRFYHDDARSD